MKIVPAYPAISKFVPGSYGWAMDQLAAGNEVRRWKWPIEVSGSWETGKNTVAIWHLYKLNDYGGMCKGFNSGTTGADNDCYEGLGVDSMGYSPSPEDKEATDWQTIGEVTNKQIQFMDRMRYRHWPSYPTPKPIDDLWSIIAIAASIVAMIALMLIFGRW